MKRLLSGALILVAFAAACSGDDDERERARALQDKSIAEAAKPLQDVLISKSSLERFPANSPERAFLEFWRLAQFQAWADAVASYDPRLRASIGADRIAEALKTQAGYFRTTRPRFDRATRRDGRVAVSFVALPPTGDPIPQSMTWIRSGGGWRIFYDPFLDEALRQAAQRTTQIQVDPTSDEAGPEALRDGARASRLQSEYLQERLAEVP